MPRPAPPIRHSLVAVALCGLVSFAPACASTSDSSSPTADDTTTTQSTPKRTTTTSTIDQVASRRSDVVQAYEDAFQALATASGDPSAPHESLNAHFEGESLSFVEAELARLQADGIRIVYPENEPPIPAVTAVDFASPQEASVDVCLIDNGVQIRGATGEIVDDRVLSRATRGTLRLSSKQWKLSSAESAGDWDDGNGCDR